MYFDRKCLSLLKRNLSSLTDDLAAFFPHRHDQWVIGCGWKNIKLMSELRASEPRHLMRPRVITRDGRTLSQAWAQHPSGTNEGTGERGPRQEGQQGTAGHTLLLQYYQLSPSASVPHPITHFFFCHLFFSTLPWQPACPSLVLYPSGQIHV